MTPSTPLGHYIDLNTRDGVRVRSFVVEPAQAPHGVTVVLQHRDQRGPQRQRDPPLSMLAKSRQRTGVNPHVRLMCQQLAQHGYLAIAPSTFGRGDAGVDYGYQTESTWWGTRTIEPLVPLPSDGVMRDVEAAILHAQRVAPHLGIGLVGYCWGGLLAWRGACQFGAITAAVCHYPGGIDSQQDRQRLPLCPVLVQFPSDGRWLSRQGAQSFVDLQAAARQANPGLPDLQTQLCDARYGFMQPQHRAYHEAMARQAQQNTLKFLQAHLKIRPA